MGYFTIEELIKGDKYHKWLKKGNFYTTCKRYKIPLLMKLLIFLMLNY
jgi:hypothetical protein